MIDNQENSLPVGLKNLGNTSYINATLQCLIACDELNDYFKTKNYEKDLISENCSNTNFVEKYVELLQNVINTESISTSYLPINFVKCFTQLYPEFNNSDHQNMEEFLLVFIEYLMRWLKTTSPLHKLFNGMLQNAFECPQCKSITIMEEPFITLNLSLADYYHPTIDCYFYFNNNQTNPIVFPYKITENLTIRDMNRALTKALCIPSNSLYIVLINKDKFQNVSETLCPVNDLIINKEDRLCFLLINIDPRRSPTEIALIDSIFHYLIELESESQIYPNNNEIIRPLEISDLVKCIFIQEICIKSNNESSNLIPTVIYISSYYSFSQLYEHLIEYYSNIYNYLNDGLFAQKNNLTMKSLDTNPFIIIFNIVQPINSPIKPLKEYWKKSVLSFSSKKNIHYFIQQNYSNILFDESDFSSIEVIFSIVWNENMFSQLNNRSKPKPIIIPLFNPTYDIEDILNNYFKNKQSRVLCKKCDTNELLNQTVGILQLPELLIINLNRLNNEKRTNSLIKFPLNNFNIYQCLSNDINEKQVDTCYELIAIGNYEQMQSKKIGYYTPYVRNHLDYCWYEIYDDQLIQKIEEKKIVTPNAQMLFYKIQVD